MRLLITLVLGAALYGQSAWETEMAAGNAALGKNRHKAEQHFRAAVSAASTPPEKAAALTKLGLVLEEFFLKRPSREYLTSKVEPLYAEAINLDSAETADHALALELYSMLLEKANRHDEAVARWASAMKIRKSLISAAIDHNASGCPGGGGKKIGGDVSAPKLVFKIAPSYSEEARLMRYQGTAVLLVVIGPNGQVVDGGLERGLGLGLDEHAIDAVKKWSFDPGMKDGAPVCVSAQIEVNFRLL